MKLDCCVLLVIVMQHCCAWEHFPRVKIGHGGFRLSECRCKRSVAVRGVPGSERTPHAVLVSRVGNATEREKSANCSVAELLRGFKLRWPVERWRATGLFEDSYLELVNPHWLRFSPPPPALNYALGSVYVLLMLVGCSGNALVVFMYIRCRSLRTPGNILVVNLAVSDFFMLAKTPVFIINSFYLGPALGKTGCTMYGFLGGLTGTTSIATLSAIAFDRYSVVVRPLDPLKTLTHVRAKLFVALTWIYACVFSLVPALDIGYGRYVPEGFLTSCSFDYLSDEPKIRYFIFTFFCAAWVAPFSVIAFCYLKILRVVMSTRNVTNDNNQLSTRHVKEQTKRKTELKLAGLVIAVIILFFVSWTPYAVVSLLGIFGNRDVIVPVLSMIPALLCKSASCINPFIYIMSHPKFRSEFQKIGVRGERLRRRSSGGVTRGAVRVESNKFPRRLSREISSEDEVEIVEMRHITFNSENTARAKRANLTTIAGSIDVRNSSDNIFDANAARPPAWFRKPRVSQRRFSFHSFGSSHSGRAAAATTH